MTPTPEAVAKATQDLNATPLEDGAWCVGFLTHCFIADPEPDETDARWLVDELRKDYALALDAFSQERELATWKAAAQALEDAAVNLGCHAALARRDGDAAARQDLLGRAESLRRFATQFRVRAAQGQP